MFKQGVIRVLCYFIPVAMNMLVGGAMFICSRRFAEEGCSGIVTSSAVAVWGVVAMLGTVVVSKIVKPQNALYYIFAAGLTMILASLGFIIFNALYLQILWIAVNGCAQALFCMPFQLFAKGLESGKSSGGVVRATAFYTFSWSVGFATGALFFAHVQKVGFFINLGLAVVVTLAVTALAFMTAGKAGKNDEAAPAAESEVAVQKFTAGEIKCRDIFAILGWIIGGAGTIVASEYRSMLSTHALSSVGNTHLALITALACYVQAVTALCLYKSRSWMFKRLPVALFTIAGITGMLLLVWGKNLPVFYIAAVIYGIYSGCIYFYLVYHSLSHPTRAKFFVAGNEVIVGVTSMGAPLLGGILADKFCSGAPFIFAGLVILAAGLVQMIAVTIKIPRNTVLEENA